MAEQTETAFPEPTELYQLQLKSFIADIPPFGTPDNIQIRSGTPALPSPANQKTIDAHAPYKTDPNFKKYTGWEHASLLTKWLSDGTTTCNEFVGRCTAAMGYTKEPVGRFDILDWLNSRGLSHIWVPADSGAKPEYGDIYRLFSSEPDLNGMRTNHMGMSLHVIGDDWYTVDSGQGGRTSGADKILRNKRKWKHDALRGWVSMKGLLNAEQPLPYWLGGWWEVEEDPYDTYWYHFAANGKVSYTTRRPPSVTGLPTPPCTVGTFKLKGMFGLEISWNSADVDEAFTIIAQEQTKRRYVMQGKTSRGVKLSAKRLMMANAFG